MTSAAAHQEQSARPLSALYIHLAMQSDLQAHVQAHAKPCSS